MFAVLLSPVYADDLLDSPTTLVEIVLSTNTKDNKLQFVAGGSKLKFAVPPVTP
jgi:hypothetical protein